MNWRRTIVWSATIFLSALIGGLVANTLTRSEAVISIWVFVSSTLLYFLFLTRTEKRLLHMLAAFAIVEAIDWLIPLTLGASLSEMLSEWGSSARHLGAAVVGLTIAGLYSRRSNEAQ